MFHHASVPAQVNNSPVADYMQLPGMYPTIAGKICNGGPYKSFKDVYLLSSLTSTEKAKIRHYEKDYLVAMPATGMDPMRGRDPYRMPFNR